MHLLIPDLLAPSDFLRAALDGLALPGLTALMRRARVLPGELASAGSHANERSTPAMRWLCAQAGWPARYDCAAPIAPWVMRTEAHDPGNETWWLALPCHFAATRDHVLLAGLAAHGDRGALAMSDADATSFAEVVRTFLPEGARLLPITPTCWALHDPALDGLLSTEPARAIGRNIDGWLPSDGEDAVGAARRWRKLHNEIQMSWHIHPLNEARNARGQLAINALWLYGSGRAAGAVSSPSSPSARRTWTSIAMPTANDDDARPHRLALRAMAYALGAEQTAHSPQTAPSADALVWLDDLATSAAQSDLDAWRKALVALDRTWLQPLAASGQALWLTGCGEHTWRSWHCPPLAWRFWRRADLYAQIATDA